MHVLRGYYPHFVEIFMFRGYYPHFVEISTSRGYYPHFVDIIYIDHITRYLARNVRSIFYIHSFSESYRYNYAVLKKVLVAKHKCEHPGKIHILD